MNEPRDLNPLLAAALERAQQQSPDPNPEAIFNALLTTHNELIDDDFWYQLIACRYH